jgi:hydroxyethylthiazole kinase-like uncharacterized protein yjeF
MKLTLPHAPILSLAQAKELEEEYFAGDLDKQWGVMIHAGEAVADTALRDMRELRTIPHRPRLLVLVGKGHNGADALIATRRFLRTIPTSRAVVWPWAPKEDCRELTGRAFEELIDFAPKRIELLSPAMQMDQAEIVETFAKVCQDRGFDLLIDGVLGMQGRPGLQSPMDIWFELLNQAEQISVRVAVDLPSGISEAGLQAEALRADFTYCTGIAKSSVTAEANQSWVGRLRYLDLGFFENYPPKKWGDCPKVLASSALSTLRRLRPAHCDKRNFGHLLVLAGSRELGGAAMMTVRGALRTGVGLVTCCVPESLHSAMVASCPEAMWVPMPETPTGGLALEGLGQARDFLERANALVAGPGIGTEGESYALVREVCQLFSGPILLDADGLRPEIIDAQQSLEKIVLTPHEGELARLSGKQIPDEFISSFPGILLRKGAHPQIHYSDSLLHLFGGSSLLARGGSGDLLSGIIGALIARGDRSLIDRVSLGALWHGRAAEALARQHGQEAVCATQILDYLSFALRNDF